MDPLSRVDPYLSHSDLLLLDNLLADVKQTKASKNNPEDSASDEGYQSNSSSDKINTSDEGTSDKVQQEHARDAELIAKLKSLNDASNEEFEPTIFVSWDIDVKNMEPGLTKSLLQRYISLAQSIVRTKTDVVMFTHLLLYFSTSIPSAIMLFRHFTYWHGILHVVMQVWYAGSYTLMMHQHIHQGGILSKKYAWFDRLFPYITDPLHGHTWNSYYHHHVKHHHIEGNGPDDLSSTIRYQRDNIWHFLHYWGRFLLLAWWDLPRYFIRKNKKTMAIRTVISELSEFTLLYFLARLNLRATTFVFLIPLTVMRMGLMIGNWGQHAFVDDLEPDSDFRSSITLIDVASNRFCYNDGYHTSHHLNPRRHWRDHPVSFLQQKHTYATEKALVFRNIDYLMITYKLMRKDYNHLARCLVPIGDQIGMTIEEIATMLETKTRQFSEEDIRLKFAKSK